MVDKDRFVKVYSQGDGLIKVKLSVFVDKETGVNYMFYHDGYAGGLTPLLDNDGKPVVTVAEAK